MKTKNYEKTSDHSDTYQILERPTWDTAGEYVSSLEYEPGFINYTEDKGVIDRESIEYADALGYYAEEALAQQGDMVEEQAASQIRLIANAPFVTHASHAINKYNDLRRKGKRIPEDEWQQFNRLKDQAIWYNQLLNDYLYRYSDESFSDISQSISDHAIEYTNDQQHAARTIDGILSGARTEAATRHLLDNIGVPYRTGTLKEDSKGADIFIEAPDSTEYPIDIKTSLDQLAKVTSGYNFEESGEMFAIDQGRDGSKRILLFPGFTQNNLGDGLKLNEERTSELVGIVGAQLMRAVNKVSS